jgi:hypothetical protein
VARDFLARAAVAVDNARLYTRERAGALALQRGLLPRQIPEIAGLDLACRYVPAESAAEVGGDWFDVIPLPAGRCALTVGDVTGHDMRAASLMGQLCTRHPRPGHPRPGPRRPAYPPGPDRRRPDRRRNQRHLPVRHLRPRHRQLRHCPGRPSPARHRPPRPPSRPWPPARPTTSPSSWPEPDTRPPKPAAPRRTAATIAVLRRFGPMLTDLRYRSAARRRRRAGWPRAAPAGARIRSKRDPAHRRPGRTAQ